MFFDQATVDQNFSSQTYRIYIVDESTFDVFTPQQPQLPPPTLSEFLLGLGISVVFAGGVIVVAGILNAFSGPIRNDEPLTATMRRYIRERDDEICFYCGDYASDGHVDHRISRANGGSNDVENLTWACVFCNCSKGSMNDYDYIDLIENY